MCKTDVPFSAKASSFQKHHLCKTIVRGKYSVPHQSGKYHSTRIILMYTIGNDNPLVALRSAKSKGTPHSSLSGILD